MLTLCHNFFRVSPNNKNKEGTIENKRKYALGITVLLLVVILWVLSSEITKYIYSEKKIERPFLVTYVRCSLLFIYLVVLCFTPPTKDPCRPADYTQLLEPTAETDDENFSNELNSTLSDSTFVPVRAGETTDSDDAAPRAVRFNKVAEVRVMSARMAGEALLARLSWSASLRASQTAQRRAAAAATTRHLKLALLLTLPWFLSNYLFRLSLFHTSASSATIYCSSTAAISLTLGALFATSASDKLTLSKCTSVVLTVTALSVLGVSESNHTSWTAILSSLGSALLYAVHLLLFRQEMRKGDGVNAPLLVGVVGSVVCACTWVGWWWPLSPALSALSPASPASPASPLSPASPPSPPSVARMLPLLLLDAAAGPLLAESLWLWGRSLTSSQTATALLGLTMPLSTAVDTIRGNAGFWQNVAALLAAAGWMLAVVDVPSSMSPVTWFTNKMRAAEGFSAIRNIPELNEQSEALMSSSDEPT